MSSSSLLKAPLSVLKSVKSLQDTQFDHLDFQLLYDFLYKGATHALKKRDAYNKMGTADALENGVNEEAEKEVEGEFERYVGRHVESMAVFMETVAPLLVKFSKILDETKRFVRRQLGHLTFLVTMFSLFAAGIIIFIHTEIANVLEVNFEEGGVIKWPDALKTILKWFLLFIVLYFVFYCLFILFERRRERLSEVDFGSLERLDRELARNTYVLFADAYARGVHKEFVKTDIKRLLRKYEDEENEEPAILEAKLGCSASSPSGTNGGSRYIKTNSIRHCALNLCDDDKDLAETLRDGLKSTWTHRSDAENQDQTPYMSGCDSLIIYLMKNLAEVKKGNLLKTTESSDLWHDLRTGVDGLRTLVLRTLDIPDASARPDRPLDVVNDQLVPLLKLNCIQTTKLKPLKYNIHSLYNTNHKTKEICWKTAISDPTCVWAYFVPGLGCMYASRLIPSNLDVDAPEHVALHYTPDAEYPAQRDAFPDDGNDAEYAKGLLLYFVKKERPQRETREDMIFATSAPDKTGVASAMSNALILIPRSNAGNDDRDRQSDPLADALMWCLRRTADDGASDACAVTQETTMNESDERPVRVHRGGAVVDPQLAAVFPTDPERLTGTDMRYFLKRNRWELLEEVRDQDSARRTQSVLAPWLVGRLKEILKKQHGRLHPADYFDYFDTQLAPFYGPSLYEVLRPGLREALEEAERAVEELKQNMAGGVKYVSIMRFEEKFRKMDAAQVRDLLRTSGTVSEAGKNLLQQAQRRAAEGEEVKSISDKVIRVASVTFLTLLFMLLIMYGINKSVEAETPVVSKVLSVLVAVLSFLFVIVVMAAMITRRRSNQKFNQMISEDNSRVLLMSAFRVASNASDQLEYKLWQKYDAAEMTCDDVRRELREAYTEVRYVDRLDKLGSEQENTSCTFIEDGKIRTQEADAEALYREVRKCIDMFDRCNTLNTGPSGMPFPTYEITMYVSAAAMVLVVLAVALSKMQFFTRMRNIGTLGNAKSALKRDQPIDEKFIQRIIQCQDVNDTTKYTVMGVGTLMFAVFLLFLMQMIVSTSQNYEGGLYASGLYLTNRCTSGQRQADE